MKQRIAMVVEYDGSGFCGWQRQANGASVQAAIEDALARIEGGEVEVVAAGRTDAGVHAEAMAVHLDVDAGRWKRAPRAYLHGVNAHLPPAIRVIAARAVPAGFHARFDCIGRSYRYRIWNRTTASALHRWRHWWMPRPLDLDAMRRAAACCIGERDFSALRASGCQAAHAVRRIDAIVIARQGCEVLIDVDGNAFLYRMVRNLVGNLVDVGTGRRSVDGFRALLEAGDRSKGAPTAPAHGLYFTDARYPDWSARGLARAR
ncbi:MAG: tRNA pseudouridine(38-40) synthase TruA [Mariprofundaceae bacterium]